MPEPTPELGWSRSKQGHNTLKQDFRRCNECKQGFYHGQDYSWVPIQCPHCDNIAPR